MAKLDRKQQKIFASNADSTQVTAFRTAGGTPTYSKDVDDIQNEKFTTGWLDEENTGNVIPYAEDMNGVFYAFTRNLAYLYQQGIPEWSNSETYYLNAMCMYNGVLYQSLANDNTNRQPDTQTTYWQVYASPISGSVTGAENLGTGAGVYAQVASNKIQLKSLVAGSNVSLAEAEDSITISASGGGGSASVAWGDITGSLASQTDLATALSQRGTLSGNNTWTGSNTFGTILPGAATNTLGNSSNYWEKVFTSYITSDEGISYIFEDTRFAHSRFKVGWNGASLGIFPEMSSTDNYSSYLGDSVYRWDEVYSVNGNFSGVATAGTLKTNNLNSVTDKTIISYNNGTSDVSWLYVGKDMITTQLFELGLYPHISSDTYLGSSTYTWDYGYISHLNVTDIQGPAGGDITVKDSLIPDSGTTLNLGESTAPWDKVYSNQLVLASNVVVGTADSGKTLMLKSEDSNNNAKYIYFKGTSFSPTSGGVSLGDTSISWSAVYGGSLVLSSHALIYTEDSGKTVLCKAETSGGAGRYIKFNGESLSPVTTNINLGGTNNRWNTIYYSTLNPASDTRLKDNIEPLECGLDIVNALSIKSYTFKDNPNHIEYGIIAQDVVEKYPELISVPDSEDGTYGTYLHNFIFASLRAIQELSTKVDSLEQQLRESQR